MRTGKLYSATRTCGRESLGALLRAVPSGFVLTLRNDFPSTREFSVKHRIERRLLEVVRHRGIPAEVESFSPVDNPTISMVRADSFVTERLYWFGERYGYEPGGIYWWRYFCRQASHILELGANVGYYTIEGAAGAPNATYLAVEPHPGCARTCRRNVEVNGLKNVEIIEAAAVADIGSEPLILMMPRLRDHYIEAPSTGFVGRNELHHSDADNPEYDSIVVGSIEVRDLIAGVDLLKLDVEGLECVLLMSIEEELGSSRPTIFLELLDDTPRLRSLVERMSDRFGYGAYIPTLSELVPLDVASLKSTTVASRFGVRDIVLTMAVIPET